MNVQPTPTPPAAPQAPQPKPPTPPQGRGGRVMDLAVMRTDDRAFLPAALEILETPPSPVRMALILVIAALVVAALVWSAFGRIDIVAVAQGKIQPTGRVKIVQTLETGRVVQVHAVNGQRVEAGVPLIQLDVTDATAEENAIDSALASQRGERLRRRQLIAIVEAAPTASRYEPTPIDWPAETPQTVRVRETAVLVADLRQLSATLSSLEGQRAQKTAEREGLEATIAAHRELVATLSQRVDMRSTLLDKAAGTKASVIDAQETLLAQKTTLATEIGRLAETTAALESTSREMVRARETLLAENTQKIAEAERQIEELDQRQAKARARTARQRLSAPITGTVQSSSVTTVGQVVATGDELMRIVPDGSILEIEAYLPNRDVGFVHPGDAVAVKVESFPFTRYGTIPGRVLRVATDAIPEPEAQMAETTASGGRGSRPTADRAQRVQNLVFPITVALDRSTMSVDVVEVPLTSGMTVTVEVRTGDRSILQYLFSPLVQVASQAVRER